VFAPANAAFDRFQTRLEPSNKSTLTKLLTDAVAPRRDTAMDLMDAVAKGTQGQH
jgi:hypothetical protein